MVTDLLALLDDGCVKAAKKIRKDDEICMSYTQIGEAFSPDVPVYRPDKMSKNNRLFKDMPNGKNLKRNGDFCVDVSKTKKEKY